MQRRRRTVTNPRSIARTEPLERRWMMDVQPDRFEPNDSFDQPTELGTLGDLTEANLTITSHNQDFYRFTAASSGEYTISILFSQAVGDLDMALYTDDDAPLARSDGTSDNEQIVFFLSADTAYKINVAGFSGAENTYTLVVDDPNAADPPPTVDNSAFNFSARQEVVLNFSEDVSQSVDLGDLHLTNLTTGQAINSSSLALNVVNDPDGKTTAVWSPSGAPLPDGNYTADLPTGAVLDSASQSNTDYSFDFYVLAGDANRDRHVDLTDVTILAANFNKTGQDFLHGNFDYSADGKVDLTDFTILAANFNKSISPPTAPAAKSPAPAAAPTKPTSLFGDRPIGDNVRDGVLSA